MYEEGLCRSDLQCLDNNVIEKMLAKKRKVNFAFLDLEIEYERTDWKIVLYEWTVYRELFRWSKSIL